MSKDNSLVDDDNVTPWLPAPECYGVCYWRRRSEFANCLKSLLDPCFTYCESDGFQKLLAGLGFQNSRFQRNTNATDGYPIFNKFTRSLERLQATDNIGILFHGTRAQNIPMILQNGLDQRLRKGQAYGPGEYFSKEPGVSVSYCHGALKMLVFLVVLPPKRSGVKSCPPDYVVVENNDHQFPLGVITFQSVHSQVLQASWQEKDQFRRLCKEYNEAKRLANEAELKAEIIQKIIGRCIDIGSEIYIRRRKELSHVSKREIAMYVHRMLDEDIVDHYFPELPMPMKGCERDTAPIKSLNVVEQEVVDLQLKLDKSLDIITKKVQNLSL